jgi:hypothetical protein
MGRNSMSNGFSEVIFATLVVLLLAAISAVAGTVSVSAFVYGYATEPAAILAVALGIAFSIWIGWHAATTIPLTISLFRRAARDRQAMRRVEKPFDPRAAAMRTGLLRLWLVGTITWLPIGFYIWQDERGFKLAGLAAWMAVPPVAVFALGLGIRWAIAGFRPQVGP